MLIGIENTALSVMLINRAKLHDNKLKYTYQYVSFIIYRVFDMFRLPPYLKITSKFI